MMYEQEKTPKFNLAASAVIFDPSPSADCAGKVQKKRVLLAHRTDIDLWNLPGGGVEHGEAPWEAVVREVKEEVGVDVVVERLQGIYFREGHTLVFSFICKIVGGTLTLTDEASEIQYFSFEDIPLNVSPNMLDRVHDAFTLAEFITKTHTMPSVHALLKSGELEEYINDLKSKYLE